MNRFKEVKKYMQLKKIQEAETELNQLYEEKDEIIQATAAYYLGCIYLFEKGFTASHYKTAKRYFLFNMKSKYPKAFSYAFYSDIEEDKNLALQYLKKGLCLFPNDVEILKRLFNQSDNKEEIIHYIEKEKVCDPDLFSIIILHFLEDDDWNRLRYFANQALNTCDLDNREKRSFQLLYAYSLIFDIGRNYPKAIEQFRELMAIDTNDELAYAPSIGMIYAYIQMENLEKAQQYFDQIPITNKLHDLFEEKIPFNLESSYAVIFDKIERAFEGDPIRHEKAKVLYALYLYEPSVKVGLIRYQKKHAVILNRYVKKQFNIVIAQAVFDMRCHFRQFIEAYDVIWIVLKNHRRSFKKYISIHQLFDNVSEYDLKIIFENTLKYMKEEHYSRKDFVEQVVTNLVKRLFTFQMYLEISAIADILDDKEIKNSPAAFEMAYSLEKSKNPRAETIYKNILELHPENTTAINHLGIIYENKNQYMEALYLFKQAEKLCPDKPVYTNNIQRVNKKILLKEENRMKSMSQKLNLDSLLKIGYTTRLKFLLYKIKDETIRKERMEELEECAIALILGLDKIVPLLCRNLSRTLLVSKLLEKGIVTFDLTQLGKKSVSRVEKMKVSELVYVAKQENLIGKGNDDRNECKKAFSTSKDPHEQAVWMWNFLKNLIEDLYA